ncbi:MAG: BON domain-containing protein [Alphaproteobacteria bacterium]|nr:BON domain-containing protein [Alphaproteobacteria bacterium]
MTKNATRQKHASRFPAFLCATLLLLAACTPTGAVIGAGATAGVAASEERGIKGSVRDAGIRIEINDLWLNEGLDLYNQVGLQIYEGRVLLTGRVPTAQMADQATRLAWQPDNVREVINEIQVKRGAGIEAFARDALINARLDSALLFTDGISSINYSTRTVAGTVYLLGVAQNQAELDRVFQVTRNIPDVKEVVSHVLLIDDPRRLQQPSVKPSSGT